MYRRASPGLSTQRARSNVVWTIASSSSSPSHRSDASWRMEPTIELSAEAAGACSPRSDSAAMPPPYRLAIFDFDGTLADSWRLMGRALVEAADEFGYRKLSDEEAEALRGQDNRAVMAAMGVKMWQLPRIVVH